MARRPISRFRHDALAAAALACGAALACAGKSVRNEDGDDASAAGDSSADRGGRSGSGTTTGGRGGTTGAGGSKAVGGSAGTPAGGASGAITGGISGTASGGDTGSGGSSGTGMCKSCIPTTCSTIPIPTETINDFENLLVDSAMPTSGIYGVNDATGMPKPEWWLGYFSGSFAYPFVPELCSGDPAPPYPIASNDVSGELRVTGTVGTYSGFGIWFGQCIVDMSAYSGISFTIGGNAGADRIAFRVHTNTNTAPDQCLVGRGTCEGSSTGGCAPAGVSFFVTETPEVKRLRFETLIGGLPTYSVDPAEVVQLSWAFAWYDGATPYDVDVTVDDVVLFR